MMTRQRGTAAHLRGVTSAGYGTKETKPEAVPIAELEEMPGKDKLCECHRNFVPCRRPAGWLLKKPCGHRTLVCTPCKEMIMSGQAVGRCRQCFMVVWPETVSGRPV